MRSLSHELLLDIIDTIADKMDNLSFHSAGGTASPVFSERQPLNK